MASLVQAGGGRVEAAALRAWLDAERGAPAARPRARVSWTRQRFGGAVYRVKAGVLGSWRCCVAYDDGTIERESSSIVHRLCEKLCKTAKSSRSPPTGWPRRTVAWRRCSGCGARWRISGRSSPSRRRACRRRTRLPPRPRRRGATARRRTSRARGRRTSSRGRDPAPVAEGRHHRGHGRLAPQRERARHRLLPRQRAERRLPLRALLPPRPRLLQIL